MNPFVSSLQALTRKTLASAMFKVFLVAYVLQTLATAILHCPDPLFCAGLIPVGSPEPDWLILTATGVSIVTASCACYLIIRLLVDLGGERFFRGANVCRFRKLTSLAAVDFLAGMYLQSKLFPSDLPNPYGDASLWQMELSDYLGRVYTPIYMLVLIFLWFGFSLLLSEAIRIQEENRQIV